MKAVLDKLARAPVGDDGFLDCPLPQYLNEVGSPVVASLLFEYARGQKDPTLRSVLADRRLRQWVSTSGSTPLGLMLRKALLRVAATVDDDDDDEDEDEDDAVEPRAPTQSFVELVAWAEEVGVSERLADPAVVLYRRTHTGMLHADARALRGATVGQLAAVATGAVEEHSFTPRGPAAFARLAHAWVRDCGLRVLAARVKEAELVALAHTPEGEGPASFRVAVDAAIARLPPRSEPEAGACILDSITFEKSPPRAIVVKATLLPDRNGRTRARAARLLLDEWRSGELEAHVRTIGTTDSSSVRQMLHVLLHTVRDVLRDPSHKLHAKLTGFLREAPWMRVLRELDEAAPVADARPFEHVEWFVVRKDNAVSVTPRVLRSRGFEGRVESVDCGAEAIARAPAHVRIASLDRDVGRVLAAHTPNYFQRDPRALQMGGRNAAFKALSLLEGHDLVRSKVDAPLHVVSGKLAVRLERDDAAQVPGWRFAFELADASLTPADVRAALDERGTLIHLDPARGVCLLARLSPEEARPVLAMVRESATFPEDAGPVLADTLAKLSDVLEVAVPEALAGEPVTPDARPVVRVVLEALEALSLAFHVRPIAGGTTFAPGKGRAQILQRVGGRAASTTRSFADETEKLAALRAALEPAAVFIKDGTRARVRGFEAVLAVIETLRAAVTDERAIVEWPREPLPSVVAKANASKLALRIASQRDWFAVDGSAEVDGVTISLASLMAARRDGLRYVQVGPTSLIEIEDDLRACLGELAAVTCANDDHGGLEIPYLAAPVLAELVSSRKQLDAAPAYWKMLARVDAATASEPRVPKRFESILRPYQVEGFRWMSRLAAWGAGACLADDMGLGKTIQTLAVLEARRGLGPALVVAPTSVGPNWLAEVKRFAPSLKAVLYRGTGREELLENLGKNSLVVTSYELLQRTSDIEALERVSFATAVFDEAQSVKNNETTRARAARRIQAGFRIALTGTPVENRIGDLYSIINLLNPGLLGTESQFRARFVVPIERDRDPVQSAALARLVRPFILRRTKSEVLTELPARTEISRPIERSMDERRLYEAARQLALEAIAEDDSQDGRFRILAEIMRLRRLACHPRLDDDTSQVPSSKLEAFLELVDELRAGGHRALVFSQFTGHLALVAEALTARAVSFLYLDGSTPLADRTARVAAFQAGEGDVFLISLRAGGTGLNLTGADTVVHLDPWWNPAVEDQATDRAHRIGQHRPVTVVRLLARGTIEETVMSLHATKRELAQSILEGSGASGKLSVVQLGALIRGG